MGTTAWHSHYTAELSHARQARAAGNEGMARVCARRAVGWVLGEYFHRRGLDFPDPSAYERVKFFQQLPDVRPEWVQVAGHFNLRINTEHQLPVEADLIAEAQWLKEQLLDADRAAAAD